MDSIKRIIVYDYLRALAALMVVAIHTDSITSSSSNYLGGISWWLANIVNSFSRAAVPLFIILSGTLILKNYNSKQNINSKIYHRLIIPSIFWITLYFFTQWKWHGINYDISKIIVDILNSAVGHLYYLFIAIGLYAFTPYLSKMQTKFGFKTISLAALIVILINAYFYLTGIYNPFTSLPLLWLFYLPYYLMGSMNIKPPSKTILIISIIICVGINSASNYLGNLHHILGQSPWWMKQMGNYFWDTLSPTTFILSTSLWLLFTSYLKFPRVFNNFVGSIASASYGVYLIHPFVLWLVDHYFNLSIHLIKSSLWAYYIGKIALIFLISYIITLFIKKIRVISPIIGESTRRIV